MNDTLVMPPRRRIDRTDQILAAVGTAAFIVIALIFAPLLSTPSSVEQVTIRNSGAWTVNVSISGTDSSDWLPLGVAHAGSSSFTDVLDPGDAWRVRYTSGDVSYTEWIERSRLVASKWVINVPDTVLSRIRDSGADAPPSF